MDTKKHIEDELQRIGKDRRWLAEKSGYSYFSVRDCLAPDGKKLSTRMMSRFLEEIRKHDEQLEKLEAAPDRITVEVSSERLDRYLEAADLADQQLKPWIISELNKAAEEWLAKKNQSGLRVAEDPTPYRFTKKTP